MSNKSRNQSDYRYIAYLRKSEERLERQMLSIPAQKRKIEEIFPDLKIIDFVEETKSAFKPGRPLFNHDVLKRIENGEADGVVGWHPNRISRNEIDAAQVSYMLRSGVMKDLKFGTYTFENTPEGIWMLQNMMSQSQYESAKQGRDVGRGMEQKAIQGERPGSVALGYKKVATLDEHGEPIIRPKDQKVVTYTSKDPERYDLVKRMWTMFLSGKYSVAQIRRAANEEWCFTTREYKGRVRQGGGGPISQSGMYRIFNNVFYTGWIMHNGELHKGNHPAMISMEDFDYVQNVLGKYGKPRSGVKEYAYTSIMRCGVCGCSVAGKLRRKWIKSEQRYKTYVYYYCIRKSDKRPCNQKIYTTLDELETQIDQELKKYTILPEFRDLAIEILHKNHLIEVKERNQIAKTQTHKKEEVQKQIDELVAMRTRQLLDDEEYIDQKNKLKIELAKVIDNIGNTDKRADEWLELTEKAFDFAKYARTRFARTNDLTVKRDILLTLGQNLLLKDRKLTLQTSSWLVPIGEKYPELEQAYLREVRTAKNTNRKVLLESLTPIIESWRAQWDSNPRHPA
jgi:site-specific DNA recombinase